MSLKFVFTEYPLKTGNIISGLEHLSSVKELFKLIGDNEFSGKIEKNVIKELPTKDDLSEQNIKSTELKHILDKFAGKKILIFSYKTLNGES